MLAAGGLLIWRVALLVVGAETWVYFGPDTNAYALLLGALVASLVREGFRPPAWVAPVGLAAVIAVAALPVGASTALWLQPLSGLAGAGVVAGAASVKAMGWRPLGYAGRISYGLYLWHMPLLAQVEHLGWAWRWAACLVAFPVASLSFHVVESRFVRPPSTAPSDVAALPDRTLQADAASWPHR
jgi:peptidoglycan/LPS O-acetylase OafA/YrhL